MSLPSRLAPLLVAALATGFSLAAEGGDPAPAGSAQPPAPPLTANAPPAAEPPAPAVRKPLSSRERKSLAAALPERYRVFLEDTDPIMFSAELDVFLRLTGDGQRDRFIDLFWRRRNDVPGGRNSYRETYYERLAVAKEEYGGAATDPGRVLLIQGEPDEVRKPDCQEVLQPLEVWIYSRLPAWRRAAALIFYRPNGMGQLKLWMPLDGLGQLFVPGQNDAYRCLDGGYMGRLLRQYRGTAGLGTLADYAKLTASPEVSLEGLDSILAGAPLPLEGAAPLPFGRVLRFPRMSGNRIMTEIVLLVGRDWLARKSVGDETFVDLELVGEIVSPAGTAADERLVDSFRYRFDVPVRPDTPAVLPFVAERMLRPGQYRMRLRLTDANRRAAGLLEEPLPIPDRPEGEDEARREEARSTLESLSSPGATALAAARDEAIRIEPVAGDALVGLKRIETTASPETASVEFLLDGKTVATRRQRPFELDVDLGPLPRPRTVRVVARDAKGNRLGSDELVLNESRDALRVRIVAPQKGDKSAGPTRVEAMVVVPEGHRAQQVELFLDDRKVATLFGPPWATTVNVREPDRPSTIRVLATIDDGSSAEDLRFVNAPEYLEEVEVERIELYVTASDGGKLVPGLTGEDFRVTVDGAPVAIDGFEVVRELPLSVVVAVDTSESMRDSLSEAERAAAGFLKAIMTPKDRAALIRFDDEPMVVQRFTSDVPKLSAALAGLSADRGTALWDATVYSLFQFQGRRGRKAVVLLTDGKDTDSRFSFDDALDYAKRGGATIYTIGLAIPGREIDVRSKLGRLAEESGGRSFFIETASSLEGTYAVIDKELRTQYRITFAPPGKPDGRWHRTRVETPKKSGIEIRTASGFYR